MQLLCHQLLAIAMLVSITFATTEEVKKHVPPEMNLKLMDSVFILGDVTKDDYILDLGGGDGRLLRRAAQKFPGLRGRGIETRPEFLKLAQEATEQEHLTSLISFSDEDYSESDLSMVTVVFVHHVHEMEVLLHEHLINELKEGTRVITHDFTFFKGLKPKGQFYTHGYRERKEGEDVEPTIFYYHVVDRRGQLPAWTAAGANFKMTKIWKKHQHEYRQTETYITDDGVKLHIGVYSETNRVDHVEIIPESKVFKTFKATVSTQDGVVLQQVENQFYFAVRPQSDDLKKLLVLPTTVNIKAEFTWAEQEL